MDFDSILRFFSFTKSGETSNQDQDGLMPTLQDEVSVDDFNPSSIQDFAESFKMLNMLDESIVQEPINVNDTIDETFLYHNDDITVIDLEKAEEGINWNAFMQYDEDSVAATPINLEKKTATMDPAEIIDAGNNLIFAGDEFDTINFEDEGWTQIEHIAGDTQGNASYDVFLHVDTGAVVQVDSSIITHYPEG